MNDARIRVFLLDDHEVVRQGLRALLEADTPDCERPVVWTNAAHRWSAPALAVPRRSEDDASSAADVA